MGRAIIGGAVAVLMFDAAAAWASLVFGFPYGSVAIGSWIIYAVVGFVAGRYSGVLAALVAGVAVGLVDASAGWAISWMIGPGRVPGAELTAARWTAAAIYVSVIAGVAATVGGVIGRFTRPTSSPEA